MKCSCLPLSFDELPGGLRQLLKILAIKFTGRDLEARVLSRKKRSQGFRLDIYYEEDEWALIPDKSHKWLQGLEEGRLEINSGNRSLEI